MGFDTFGEAVARAHSTHAKSVEVFLENSIMLPRDASEAAQKAELQSESYTLIGRLLELAKEHCEEVGLEPGSEEALAAFEEAHETATSIVHAYQGLPFSMEERKALSPDQVTEKLALRVQPYVIILQKHIMEKGKLRAEPVSLSRAVGRYVRGRFKSPTVDGILAQLLTQVEITAYLDEMLSKNPMTRMSKLDELRPPSVIRAVCNVSALFIMLWLVSLGIAALPMVVSALPANAMLFAGLGLGALGTIALLALMVAGLIGLSRENPRKRMQQNSALDLINRMNDFFYEFRSAGPFSTAYFRKRVYDLAEAGVVWPSGLFILLDDMELRGVRSF